MWTEVSAPCAKIVQKGSDPNCIISVAVGVEADVNLDAQAH